MSIKIVDAKPGDIYGIRRVQRITWAETYPNQELGITKEDIEARFDRDQTPEGQYKMELRKNRIARDPYSHTWVAKDGEEIVGFCIAEKEAHEHRIGAIYVLPKYQRLGIGKMLMEKGFNWLGNERDISVKVASYNKKAIKFYESFGFKTVRESFLDDKLEPLPSGIRIPENEMVKK